MSIKTLNWKYVRILLVSTGIISGFQFLKAKLASPINFPSPLVISLITLIIIPLLMLAVATMNAKRLPKFWNPPQWDINPFSLNEPFQLFHVMSWQVIVSGVVACLLLPWAKVSYTGYAVLNIVSGISGLLGIYISMRVFHKRLRKKVVSIKDAFFGSWQESKSVK